MKVKTSMRLNPRKMKMRRMRTTKMMKMSLRRAENQRKKERPGLQVAGLDLERQHRGSSGTKL